MEILLSSHIDVNSNNDFKVLHPIPAYLIHFYRMKFEGTVLQNIFAPHRFLPLLSEMD